MEIKNLFDFSKPPYELLHEILLKRGFLVQLDGAELTLSDNAVHQPMDNLYSMGRGTYISDLELLSDLLRRSEIGTIDSQQKIHIEKLDVDQLYFFRFKEYSGESGTPDHYWNWNYFIKTPSLRVPVTVLEPYIALLVKSFSAIGIFTDLSCDGHGSYVAWISFVGNYHTVWADALISLMKIYFKFDFFWEVNEQRYLMIDVKSPTRNVHESREKNTRLPDNYYKEILNVGVYLYQNREFFRQMKTDFIKTIDVKEVHNVEYFKNKVQDFMKTLKNIPDNVLKSKSSFLNESGLLFE